MGVGNQVFLQRGEQSSFFTEGWAINIVYRGLDNQVFLHRGGQSSFLYRGVDNQLFFTEWWTINFF